MPHLVVEALRALEAAKLTAVGVTADMVAAGDVIKVGKLTATVTKVTTRTTDPRVLAIVEFTYRWTTDALASGLVPTTVGTMTAAADTTIEVML